MARRESKEKHDAAAEKKRRGRPAMTKEDTPATRIGRMIAQRRDELGMTQLELATKAGMSQSFIADVEGGRNMRSQRTIATIADALDCELVVTMEIRKKR
jgi:ribosome-binding protein aMBF1 (putative translation factor)